MNVVVINIRINFYDVKQSTCYYDDIYFSQRLFKAKIDATNFLIDGNKLVCRNYAS